MSSDLLISALLPDPSSASSKAILGEKAIVVSVVRDMRMYERCVRANPCVNKNELVCLDNRKTNETVPKRYNAFIEGCDLTRDVWIMFCHEDFQLSEDLSRALGMADRGVIYGPIGAVLVRRHRCFLGGLKRGNVVGLISESDKSGVGCREVGRLVPMGTRVDTVDCQCLLVHTSLLRRTGLRFDENLSFDLYAEDFCIQALKTHGVLTCILPLKCSHFSHGTLSDRFYRQKDYLCAKHPDVEAMSCVGYMIGGGRFSIRRLQEKVRFFAGRHMKWLVRLYWKIA